MNVEDEHEYEQFYDFSKTYEGYPDAATNGEEGKEKTPLITKKSTQKKEDDVDEVDGWEDVDVEDAASAEEVESSEDEDKKSNV